jgi:uncharacterized membrane protein
MSTDSEGSTNTKHATEKIGESAQNMAQRTYGDFLGAYKSFSDTTSKIVQQAATVLEAEIASGIKVANQAENRLPQMEKFRSEKPDEVMQRFRRDAHEVVDIFIDVVGATLKSMPNLTEIAPLKASNVTVKPTHAASTQHPVIMAPQPVKAGQTAEIQISFENNRETQTEEFKLFSTDLISNSGDRLSAALVKFAPETMKIAPFQTMQIKVAVAIPEETTPGTYSGLVLASNMSDLRSEIVIKVE